MGFVQDIKEAIELLKEKIRQFKYAIFSLVIIVFYVIFIPIKYQDITIILHWLIAAAGLLFITFPLYSYEKKKRA